MKSLSITTKLLLLCVPALIVLGALSFTFFTVLNTTSQNSERVLYNELFVPEAALINADRDLYQAYVAEDQLEMAQTKGSVSADDMDAFKGDFTENTDQVAQRVKTAFESIKANKDLYEVYQHETAGVTLKALEEKFNADYQTWYATNPFDSPSTDIAAHVEAFGTARDSINLMEEILEAYAAVQTKALAQQKQDTIVTTITVVAVVAVVLIVLAIFVIRYLKRSIGYITGISKRIAQGELTLTIDRKTFSRDEVGQLSQAMGMILARLGEYSNYIAEITSVLETMEQGNMKVQLTHSYEGEFASIKNALLGISTSLNRTLGLIDTAAEQVSSGASQVASGAQALATGSTQQASAVEQLTAAVGKIAEQAADNSNNVKMATQYVTQANANVRDGDEHMKQLTEAMANISASSSQITNITATIEDIAFQTNILALNAAIEAARAGSAGKGFAVVADEVRSLAAKSAEAARQTAELIQRSVTTVSEGSQLTAQTAQILRNIEDKTTQVNDIINKINQASAEQAVAIDQVKQGLGQVSTIVQTNAATAEENSATSEQMSAQAATLRQEVGKFTLEEEREGAATISLFKEFPGSTRPALGAPSRLGKY